MKNEELRYSRKARFKHYIADLVSGEVADKIYARFDELPDRVLMVIDNNIYEELEYDGYFK